MKFEEFTLSRELQELYEQLKGFMLLTLADARRSRLPTYLGLCPESDDFTSYINEAMQRLIVRGNWEGTYQRFRLCTNNDCLTFPRQFQTVQALSLCNIARPIRNMWWEFIPNGDGIVSNGCSHTCPGPQFVDKGWYPTFNDVSSTGGYLRAYASDAADYGKKIHIFGYDQNNQWIRTTDGGEVIDGFKMTLAAPYVQSSFTVNSVIKLQKEETSYNVLLYEIDPSDGSQLQLGVYEPSETVASYRRYKWTGSTGCSNCDTQTWEGIAKLNFIPVKNAYDYLYISNIPALKEMCKAIKYGEMESDGAEVKMMRAEAAAVRELNHQKQTVNGNNTIPVRLQVFGGAKLGNQKIGWLT